MSTEENGDDLEDFKPSISTAAMPVNLGFSTEQTLFVIDLIREYIEADGEGPPRSLKELSYRLKLAKKSKKQMWESMAEKLRERFNENFLPERVQRKWFTLVEGYKRVKDNNALHGKGPIRFKFYKEMNDLIGGQDDFVFPVVGSSRGLEVRGSKVLDLPSKAFSTHLTLTSPSILFGTAARSTQPLCSTYNAAPRSPLSNPPSPSPYCRAPSPVASTSSVDVPVAPPRSSRKRRREEDMVAFLREAEVASQRRHEETLAQLKSAQENFEALLTKIIEKM